MSCWTFKDEQGRGVSLVALLSTQALFRRPTINKYITKMRTNSAKCYGVECNGVETGGEGSLEILDLEFGEGSAW